MIRFAALAAFALLCVNAVADDRVYTDLTYDPDVAQLRPQWTDTDFVFYSHLKMYEQFINDGDEYPATWSDPEIIKRVDLRDRQTIEFTPNVQAYCSLDLLWRACVIAKNGTLVFSEFKENGLADISYVLSDSDQPVLIANDLEPMRGPSTGIGIVMNETGLIVWLVDRIVYEYQIPFDGVARTEDLQKVRERTRLNDGFPWFVQLQDIAPYGDEIAITDFDDSLTFSRLKIIDSSNQEVLVESLDLSFGRVSQAEYSSGVLFYRVQKNAEWPYPELRAIKGDSKFILPRFLEGYVYWGPRYYHNHVSDDGRTVVYNLSVEPRDGTHVLGVYTWDGETLVELPDAHQAGLDDRGNAIVVARGRQSASIIYADGETEHLTPSVPPGHVLRTPYLDNKGNVFFTHYDPNATSDVHWSSSVPKYKSHDIVIGEKPASPLQLLAALRNNISNLNLANGISNSLDVKLNVVEKAVTSVKTGDNVAALNALKALINEIHAQSPTPISEAEAASLIDSANTIIELLQ